MAIARMYIETMLPNLVVCVTLTFGRVSVVSRGGLPGFPIFLFDKRRRVESVVWSRVQAWDVNPGGSRFAVWAEPLAVP